MKSLAALTALVGASAIAGSALADGGYYQGALGARAAGRGGAFVARADDVTAVAINPAGLAQLDGTVIEIGNQVGYNGYDYTRAPTLDYGQTGTPLVSFNKVSNGAPWQPALPFIGVASRLGLHDWSFALSASVRATMIPGTCMMSSWKRAALRRLICSSSETSTLPPW